ncbi:MAG: hypothetical protein KatS3mg105_4847 [Gemmatales bacterium]|nr:MAG: hypothetical protein KatS3mg105_4847 [Gemmatales bacterium]
MPGKPISVACLMLVMGMVQAEEGKDKEPYAKLSDLIHKAIVKKAPKEFEDKSDWGKTVPPPAKVRFPRLRRVVVKVDGRDEFPHGVWNRWKIWLDDPAKDITVKVVELKKIEPSRYHVKLTATVALHAEAERNRWRNGVKLFGISVQADAKVAAEFDCDVRVAVDATSFPPAVSVQPKILKSQLQLEEFDLNRIGVVQGELVRELGDELKVYIETVMKLYEDEVKKRANEAIAQSLDGGKAKLPLTELLQLK